MDVDVSPSIVSMTTHVTVDVDETPVFILAVNVVLALVLLLITIEFTLPPEIDHAYVNVPDPPEGTHVYVLDVCEDVLSTVGVGVERGVIVVFSFS